MEHVRRMTAVSLPLLVLFLAATTGAGAQPLFYVPDHPPIASSIQISTPDVNGDVVVSGLAGAVPGRSVVVLATLDTGHVVLVDAAADGSFSGSIFGPPGASIMIKADPVGLAAQTFVQQSAQQLEQQLEPFSDALAPMPGTILRVPDPPPIGTGIPFSGTSRVNFGSTSVPAPLPVFTVQGTVNALALSPGETLTVQGTLRIQSPVLAVASDPSVQISLTLERVSGADGRGVLAQAVFSSAFMTPTGLAIERLSRFGDLPFGFAAPPFAQPAPDVAVADFNLTLLIPADQPSGYYRPRLNPSFTGVPAETPNRLVMALHSQRLYLHTVYLPVLRVGNPPSPGLPLTLLANAINNGVRGAGALEDRGHFGLGLRVGTPGDAIVLPRLDPISGQPITYRLEPFATTISAGRGRLPSPPLIPFKFPSGQLTVRIQAPDGGTRVLGPAPFVQNRLISPGRPDGEMPDYGPIPTDLYELSTLDPRFEVQFTQDGRHLVTIDADVLDLWGNTWSGGGTYEIHVARALAIDTAVLPGTPFEVGDTFSPALVVSPPLPADVEVRMRFSPGSESSRLVEWVVRGRANRFGYLSPLSGFVAFEEAGEYRVDVTASFLDDQGQLWMGTRTWGSVVAPRSSSIAAHGRRGLEKEPTIGQQWFFRSQTEFPVPGTDHVFVPFNSGDVNWAHHQDSSFPSITFQDVGGGTLASLMRQRAFDPSGTVVSVPMDPPGTYDERAAVGETPLFSSRPDGVDPHVDPSRVDLWAYSYRSIQRPLVRVREEITDETIQGVYWSFRSEYMRQIGAGPQGDLPNDIKFMYGAAVLRGAAVSQPRYAIHGSLWVHLPSSEPVGNTRVFPPFQGNGGGPSGGPIMTLQGRPIDLFIHLTGVRPGSVLEVGDVFALSGAIGPPLPALVFSSVTKPDGTRLDFNAHANRVGYYYHPADNFLVDQPGLWTVDVKVVFEGVTSAGQVTAPFPSGDVLGTASGRFSVYVVPRGSPMLTVDLPHSAFLPGAPVLEVHGSVSGAASVERAQVTSMMPGFVLTSRDLPITGGAFTHRHDPVALNHDFPNLDVPGVNAPAPADLITLSLFAQGHAGDGSPVYAARVVALHGDELLNLGVQNVGPASPLVAAVLPASRSVQVGTTATAFATVINTAPFPATGVSIAPPWPLPAALTFQRTDPATNLPLGAPGEPVDIGPGAAQSFVVALTPSAPIAPADLPLAFASTNLPAAEPQLGLNTLLLSAAPGPVPDIVALAATPHNDGIVGIPGVNGAAAFAVATVNLGAGGAISATPDTGGSALPLVLAICQTNPATGACLGAPQSTVTVPISTGATPTFAVFVGGAGTITSDPAAHRVFLRFRDADGVTRGATSVAVRTN